MSDMQDRIEANWRAITFELDAPRPHLLERLLTRIGASSGTARLVAATPALRRSWAAALAVVVLLGLVAAGDSGGDVTAMLLLAPLLPVLGVALAYGPSVDPIHEIGVATPMRGLRVVMIRAATVSAIAVALVGGSALLVADTKLLAAVWLLPALAATGTAISLMTITTPRRAVMAVAVGWAVLTLAVQSATGDVLDVFGPAAQAVSVVVAAGVGLVLTRRREGFDRVVA